MRAKSAMRGSSASCTPGQRGEDLGGDVEDGTQDRRPGGLVLGLDLGRRAVPVGEGGASSTVRSRSARSPASRPASMVVRAMHRWKARTVTSSSVCRARSTIPSPVTALHSVSDSQAGMVETLSRVTIHEAEADAAHERISRGGDRVGAGDGSTRDTTSRAAVVLAVPCSPTRARIGCGTSGIRHETSQATISRNLRSSTLSRPASGARLPPGRGSGQRRRQRRAPEQHRGPVLDVPAVPVDEHAAAVGPAEVERDASVADGGDPECHRFGVGHLGLALEDRQRVGQRRAAGRLAERGVVEPGQSGAQPVTAAEPEGHCRAVVGGGVHAAVLASQQAVVALGERDQPRRLRVSARPTVGRLVGPTGVVDDVLGGERVLEVGVVDAGPGFRRHGAGHRRTSRSPPTSRSHSAR